MTMALHHFVDGRKTAGTSGRSVEIFDPATGKHTATVPLASAAEIDGAVAAATRALPGWSATPPLRRARVLFRFKDLVERHIDELAKLITAEFFAQRELSQASAFRKQVEAGAEAVMKLPEEAF